MSLQKLTVPREAAGARLDKFLSAHVPGLSLERARGLIEQGHVRIRGKKCQPTRKLWGGEEIELSRPEPRAPTRRFVAGPELPVLHDDAAWVVVNKPAGLSVEPAGGNVPSVVELVAARLPPFDVEGQALPGVVHRLDRDTSGCLALARTDAAAAALERAFQEKQVDKRYWALVLGETPERERLRGATLVEVKLETGRTHQIRVQLAEAGHPVLADALYGPDETRTHPAAGAVGRHALHALRLSLPGVSVEAPLPEDFQRALALLRG
ncbi:MAG TPA: RluA family pseudouridine synthase [Cystobacter sp.]